MTIEGLTYCGACGMQRDVVDCASAYRDFARTSCNTSTYTRKGHFINVVKKFQGLQCVDEGAIQTVLSRLGENVVKHGLNVETITRSEVRTFLREDGLKDHYDNVNLLHSRLTSKPLPQIPDLQLLYGDFDLLDKTLLKLKDPGRKNSLSTNYKLFKLLQHRGFPCEPSDFNPLKDRARETHQRVMLDAFKLLDWKF